MTLFVLGHMQIGDTLDAKLIAGRGKGRFQQEFLLEVVWADNAMEVPVHCFIRPSPGLGLREPGESG